jgi:hypothetical protein
MVKTKRVPQLKAASAVYDNDLILIDQGNVTKKATFKLFKDYIGTGTGTGVDGREVELRNSGAYIQWRYVGVDSWTDLVSLADITGPTGSVSASGTVYFDADSVEKNFNPVPGIISTDATKCLVVVGGVTQQANVSYTVSLAAGGTLTFTEAPPLGNSISIQSFQ